MTGVYRNGVRSTCLDDDAMCVIHSSAISNKPKIRIFKEPHFCEFFDHWLAYNSNRNMCSTL